MCYSQTSLKHCTLIFGSFQGVKYSLLPLALRFSVPVILTLIYQHVIIEDPANTGSQGARGRKKKRGKNKIHSPDSLHFSDPILTICFHTLSTGFAQAIELATQLPLKGTGFITPSQLKSLRRATVFM